MSDAIANHRTASLGFSAIVAQAEGSWTNPSPCPEWDAAGVVEHVIAFHDELLLGPSGTVPERPRDDTETRWNLTVAAIDAAVEAPAAVDLEQLLPVLTAEVLTHMWDLAQAIGVDPNLDVELCAISYDVMRGNEEQMRATGLFDGAVRQPSGADGARLLIAFSGRDPDRVAPGVTATSRR